MRGIASPSSLLKDCGFACGERELHTHHLAFHSPAHDPEERIRLRRLLTRVAEDRLVILSTHVVEDISQTCQRLGVLDQGTLVFNGLTRQLIDAARGHTWQFLAAPSYVVPDEWRVISTLPHPEGTLYHVVGPEPHGFLQASEPLAPTLEDGYVRLRQQLDRRAWVCSTPLTR